VKKSSLVLSLSICFLFFVVLFSACKKINDATELGSDLLPPIDNVNTFDSSLSIVSINKRMLDDSSKVLANDNVAVGLLNDPVFGGTNAKAYFNLSSTIYGNYPFFDYTKTSIKIDSVILSLAYAGGYGDTAQPLTINVKEIASSETLYDTAVYTFHENPLNTNGLLGTKTFFPNKLKDTFQLIRLKDTQKVANVIRIPLDNSLGYRFANFDSSLSNPNPGFYSDSAFKKVFKGLAIEPVSAGGVGSLVYINLFDQTKTKLTIYFSSLHNGSRDTTSLSFVHNSKPTLLSSLPGGVANAISRTPANDWATALSSNVTDKIYIQSETRGSYGFIKIPGLDAFPNKVVHRAELIVTKLASTADDKLLPPPQLFLDRKNNTGDSAFIFVNDLQTTSGYNFPLFGGLLNKDNTYRFNITRYVQSILTKHVKNDTLRLYAPLDAKSYIFNYNNGTYTPGSIQILQNIAKGRVVVGGGSNTNPQVRMRLRLVYSNL